jgi:hypothetical protein
VPSETTDAVSLTTADHTRVGSHLLQAQGNTRYCLPLDFLQMSTLHQPIALPMHNPQKNHFFLNKPASFLQSVVFYRNEKPADGYGSILFVACEAGRTQPGTERFAHVFDYNTCFVWRNELCKMLVIGHNRNSEG